MRHFLLMSILLLSACCTTPAVPPASPTSTSTSTSSTLAPPPPKVGAVTVVGILTDEGVECQALRSDSDHRLYTIGNQPGFKNGDRVIVTGSIAAMSVCQQGTTLAVSSVRKAE